jgi:hypothetical protein
MENQPKVMAESVRASSLLADRSHLLDEWRLARQAHVNLLLTGMPRVNPLLTELDYAIRNVLERLLPDLHEPVASWCPGEPLALPPTTRVGTLILHDVGALTSGDQLQLLTWLDEAGGRTQVVSTTPGPLLPRVEAGTFLETLYYRLNTVCVDVAN